MPHRPVRDTMVGLRAAWSTPSVIARGMARLLEPAAHSDASASDDDARLAVRVSHAAIARLSRLHGARWRNSCLYRSVAECLVLRAVGRPARVVIGVGHGADADVIAHAWVECEGITCASTRGQAELERFTLRVP